MSNTARAHGAGVQLAGLAVSLALVAAAAAIGGWITSTSLDGWYAQLAKPRWTPPGSVIGAVWTVLYALMGLAAWLVWRRAGVREARVPLAWFGVQLALNVAWTALFFGLRSPGLALAEIALLWLSVVATTIAFAPRSRLAAWLMAPYLAWVLFAAALNAVIWRMNA